MSHRLRWGGPVLAGIGFVAAWQLVVWAGRYPVYILPDPFLVFARFLESWVDGTMWPHFVATLAAVLLGFAVGAIAALPTGYVLARSRIASRVLSPYLVAAQATPILALAPLIALWFGSGLLAHVIICALIVYFPVAVSTLVGIRTVDDRLLELGRAYRATRLQRITKLEVPAALPSVFGGLRIGVTLAVVGAIVADWAGGERGLGVLINLARGSLFDYPLMFATLMTVGLLGIVLYAIVLLVEHRVAGARY